MEKYLDLFLSFNTFVFLVNFIILILSKQILEYLDTSDLEWKSINGYQENMLKRKRKFLLIINTLIFVWYIISLFLKLEAINTFIKILVVILFAFIINWFLVRWVVALYWEKIEVNWESYIKKWYKTKIFSILTIILVIIVTFYAIIDIAGYQNWLQNGWFIGWLLAFLWFTAPVWAMDMFSSILLLHSGKVDLWDVVEFKIDGVKKYAFIKYINLSEVVLVDLVYNTPIIFRPSEFRNLRIINWSRNIVWDKSKSILQIIKAKISYDVDLEQVKELYSYVIKNMLEDIKWKTEEKYFPENLLEKITVQIEDFWDFAVIYQLIYEITSSFYIVKANRLLNIYLQKAQKKYAIDFSTPDLFVEQKCK